jgi:prepilin-type N-terminal cleavage/methylation domain-containing protein
MAPTHPKGRPAFSILELVVVMAILVVLAGLVILEIGNFQEKASVVTTKTTLNTVRGAINGTSAGQGYQQDMRAFAANQPIAPPGTSSLMGTSLLSGPLSLPSTLASLYVAPAGAPLYNPVTRLGWHGPYLTGDTGRYQIDVGTGFTADYGGTNDPAPLDAWNHPIVLQIPSDPTYARLVSAGPDGKVQTPVHARR